MGGVSMVGRSDDRRYETIGIFQERKARALWQLCGEARGSELWVLDRTNFRLLVVSAAGVWSRQISQVGQSRADLQNPIAFCLDRNGSAHVLDRDAVKVFDRTGKPGAAFSIGTVGDAIAVNSRGELLVNTPRSGHLLTVYSAQGRVLRHIGRLVECIHGYPGKTCASGPIPYNRVRLAITSDDSVYVAFEFMPLLQKFDYRGTLLWETRLQGTAVRDLVRTFWKEPDAPRSLAYKNMDGVSLDVITTGVTATSSDNCALMLANSAVICVSASGRQMAIIEHKSSSRVRIGIAEIGNTFFTLSGNIIERLTLPSGLTM